MKAEPFRPLSERTINPYALPKHLAERGYFGSTHPFSPRIESAEQIDAENIFSYPPIALDGGILLSEDIIDAIPEQSALGAYLESRTKEIPVSRIATYHNNGDLKFMHAEGRRWHTSRGEPYYMSNVTFNPKRPYQRALLLHKNLDQDFELANHWDEITDDIRHFDIESQWRLFATILQHITNDIMPLAYGKTIANALYECTDHRMVVHDMHTIATSYYKSLLGQFPDEEDESTIFSFLSQREETMDEIMTILPPTIDWVRTRRETDMTYLTLAGAESFRADTGNDTNTNIIIPLLGGFDLGPALSAVGETRPITYILPTYKESEMVRQNGYFTPRQKSVRLPIQAGDLCSEDRAILFDDTIGKGETIRDTIQALEKCGIQVDTIRTLFRNHWHPEELDEFSAEYGDRFDSYFAFPSLRNPPKESGQFILPRYISARWYGQGR